MKALRTLLSGGVAIVSFLAASLTIFDFFIFSAESAALFLGLMLASALIAALFGYGTHRLFALVMQRRFERFEDASFSAITSTADLEHHPAKAGVEDVTTFRKLHRQLCLLLDAYKTTGESCKTKGKTGKGQASGPVGSRGVGHDGVGSRAAGGGFSVG